ncbi:lipopolysaccharide biosynthesis protein [Pannonibacter tanglangensis]|uniref:Oligosaccharide flippase family protein n=1 Tax=Pannonibacter tanglangensis TaxID=2750084 RepID=A0ABW9ZP35_9HYPH|nr:lipopolysaccharide biosynthesis protein [Pannonibacter sp. XCT-34]NBN65848.1 oligosaccharide flippase family protein [Pannonibacter sp. XCT-34]
MALVTFGIRIAGAALAYLSQAVLARWMGAHDYGVFSVVWTLALVLGLLACLGFSASPGRFVPQHAGEPDQRRLRGFLELSRLIALAAACVLTLVGLEVLIRARGSVDPAYVWPAAFALLAVPLFALTAVQDAIARSYDMPALGLLPGFIFRPLLLLLLLLPLVATGHVVTATLTAAAALAASLLVTAYQARQLSRALKTRVAPGPASYDTRLWLRVSLPLLMVEGFLQLLSSADVVMVSFWRPPDEVAVYFAAAKTLALVQFVHFAVRAASAHRFAALASAADPAALSHYALQASRWTFWPSLAAGLCLVAAAPLLLWLFGPEFRSGAPLVAVLLVGILVRASLGPVDALLSMSGHQMACAAVYGAVFSLNVALNALLIPSHGLLGAATATALAVVAETVALAVLTWRRLGFVPFALLPLPATAPRGPHAG